MTLSHVFSHTLFKLGVLFGSIIVIVSVSGSLVDLWYKRDLIADREGALQKVHEKNTLLQEQLVQSKTPEFVEEEARKLGMLKVGESIVILGSETRDKKQETREGDVANWKQWWELFW